MSRGMTLVALVVLTTFLAGCARHMAPRPLRCPIVECKGFRCASPPMGMPYMSDEWRCVMSAG